MGIKRSNTSKLGKLLGVFLICASLTGCTQRNAEPDYMQLVARAKQEGNLLSLAMPNEWANWVETWDEMSIYYGIEHSDIDMNSGDELKKFAEGVGDIGDVGFAYGALAEKEGVTAKHKTPYWNEIPKWAKDDDGDWVVAYTGTMAFMLKDGKKGETLAWKDLANSNKTVGTSNVLSSSQAQYTVYAAALALGGSKDNIQPGIDLFKKLASERRLTDGLHDQETSLNSNVDVNIKWDFVALGYRDVGDKMGKHYSVCLPEDGSVTVGYVSIINNKAQHPMAARLAREYILGDSGQMNLAQGYATPIRSIMLPPELEARRIPRSQYNEKMVANGIAFNDDVGKKIAEAWKKQVLPILDEKGRAI